MGCQINLQAIAILLCIGVVTPVGFGLFTGFIPTHQATTNKISNAVFDTSIPINVTNTNHLIDGDVSSVTALKANPGSDGISLFEAITATNNAPGTYLISFAPALNGATINLPYCLPQLLGGGVTINGDINGDDKPDITLVGTDQGSAKGPVFGAGPAFSISSNNNAICSLRLSNFTIGVLFKPTISNQCLDYNAIYNCSVTNTRCGVASRLLINDEPEDTNRPIAAYSNLTWTNTKINGNIFHTETTGINFNFYYTSGIRLSDFEVWNNTFEIASAGDMGIALVAGGWANSRNNEIQNTLIANNKITGPTQVAIRIASGDVGSDHNVVDGVTIRDNTLQLKPSTDISKVTEGISIIVGDSATDYWNPTYRPVTVPAHNNLTNINIVNNTIFGAECNGIAVCGGCGMNNFVSNINLENNTLTGIGASFPFICRGVFVGGGGGVNSETNETGKYTEVSNITIKSNAIQISPATFHPASGGIAIMGSSEFNYVENITVTQNVVNSQNVLAMNIIGGAFTSYANVSGVQVIGNTFNSGDPSRIQNLKGVTIFGGLFSSLGNTVEHVNFGYNLVDGVQNDIGVLTGYEPNLGCQNVNNTITELTFAYNMPIQTAHGQAIINIQTDFAITNVTYNEQEDWINLTSKDLTNTSRWMNLTIPKGILSGPYLAKADGSSVPLIFEENGMYIRILVDCPIGTSNLQINEKPLIFPTPIPTSTAEPTATPTSPPITTPTPAPIQNASPTTTPNTTPKPQPTVTQTATPTQNVTNQPTPTVPELDALALIFTFLIGTVVLTIVVRRKQTSGILDNKH